jgi:prepilin-type N-terminal cleavage/methylation domain-containing protein
MKKSQSGFTIIELVVVIVLLGAASILFFVQKNNIQVAARDDKRKTAINAIYYNLEEVFYAKNQYYPNKLDAKDLPAMDPALLTDTNGVTIGDTDNTSEYQYEPANCNDDKCKSYTLRTSLENEADYVKKSRHN